MKKNRWASIHKVLKIGLPFYALLLFSLSSISSIGVTHAASLRCSPYPICLLTPTPTDTPTPSPTPTPTPTPTPSPTPTPTPQVQPTPIIYVPPTVAPITTETPATATPTATPISATATTVTVNPNKTTTTRTDTTSANEQPQGTGDKGINLVMISLGVATPVLLFTGGMIWFLWRRQTNQHNPAIQGQGIFGNAQASPWMNNHAMPPTVNSFPYAPSAALVPGVSGPPTVNPLPYTPPATLAPGVSGPPTVNPFPYAPPATLAPGVSGALPILGGTQPMLSPQPAYTPSDLRPMTSAFPRQMPTSSSNNGANPALNSDLQPLPLDNLSLPPQSIRERATNGNGNGQKTTGPIAVLLPPLIDTLVPFMSVPLPVPPVPVQTQATRPPSIQEDPMLEEVMRQAQMGLFILSGR